MPDRRCGESLSLMDETIIAWSADSSFVPGLTSTKAPRALRTSMVNMTASVDQVTDDDSQVGLRAQPTLKLTLPDKAALNHPEIEDCATMAYPFVVEVAETGLAKPHRLDFKRQLMRLASHAARRNRVAASPDVESDRDLGKRLGSEMAVSQWFFENEEITDDRDLLVAVDEPIEDQKLMVIRTKAQRLIFNTAEFIGAAEIRYEVLRSGKNSPTGILHTADPTSVKFHLERAWRDGQMVDLLDMDDLYYATTAKIREMVASLSARLESGFLPADQVLESVNSNAAEGGTHTIGTFLDRLSLYGQQFERGGIRRFLEFTLETETDRSLEDLADRPTCFIWVSLSEKYHHIIAAEAKAEAEAAEAEAARQQTLSQRQVDSDTLSLTSLQSSVRAAEDICRNRADAYRFLTLNEADETISDAASQSSTHGGDELWDEEDEELEVPDLEAHGSGIDFERPVSPDSDMDFEPEAMSPVGGGSIIRNPKDDSDSDRVSVNPMTSVHEMNLNEPDHQDRESYHSQTPATIVTPIPVLTHVIDHVSQLFDPTFCASALEQIHMPATGYDAMTAAGNPLSPDYWFSSPTTPQADWMNSPFVQLPLGSAYLQGQSPQDFNAITKSLHHPLSRQQQLDDFRQQFHYHNTMSWGEMMRQQDIQQERELQQQCRHRRSRDSRGRPNATARRHILGRGILKSLMKSW